jgi:hypothetical protein
VYVVAAGVELLDASLLVVLPDVVLLQPASANMPSVRATAAVLKSIRIFFDLFMVVLLSVRELNISHGYLIVEGLSRQERQALHSLRLSYYLLFARATALSAAM